MFRVQWRWWHRISEWAFSTVALLGQTLGQLLKFHSVSCANIHFTDQLDAFWFLSIWLSEQMPCPMGELYLKTVKKSLCSPAQWYVLIILAHRSLKKKDLLSQRTWAKATKQDPWFKQIKKKKKKKASQKMKMEWCGLFCALETVLPGQSQTQSNPPTSASRVLVLKLQCVGRVLRARCFGAGL